jgi:hypothetical protein
VLWAKISESSVKEMCMLRHAVVVVFLMLCSDGSLAWHDTIGIYLDSEGTSCCVSCDDNTAVNAYLLVRSPSGVLRGCEGRISWDGDLLVSMAYANPAYVNFSQFPAFNMGLMDEPIDSGEIVVIAKLSVFAMGGGNIYIDPLETASIQGVESWVLALDPIGTLVESHVEYGGSGRPSFSVNSDDCPSRNADNGLEVVTYEPAAEVKSPSAGYVLPPVPSLEAKDVGIPYIFNHDFIGMCRVVDVEEYCVPGPAEGFPPQSYLIVNAEVLEVYYGYDSRQYITCKFDRFTSYECSVYTGCVYPESIDVGDVYIVEGRVVEAAGYDYYCFNGEVLCTDGVSAFYCRGGGESVKANIAESIALAAGQLRLAGQKSRADCAVVIENAKVVDEYPTPKYLVGDVVQVIDGYYAETEFKCNLYSGSASMEDVLSRAIVIVPEIVPGEQLLVYAAQCADGYELVFNESSVFVVDGGWLYVGRHRLFTGIHLKDIE